MRKPFKFLWVDDKPEKVTSYKEAIEAGPVGSPLRATLTLFHVKKDVLKQVEELARSTTPPDLFILDHVFNLGDPLKFKGSSVAHLLRTVFPNAPMVCVTGMYDSRPQEFDQEDLSEYTALFSLAELNERIDAVFEICRDFPKLDLAKQADLGGAIVRVLKAPKRDQEDLLRILPPEFHKHRHTTTQHRIARWIFNDLLRRPGLLLDGLHVATLLGINEDGLAKVAKNFEGALYKGPFSSGANPRWWASEVRRKLFAIVGDDAPDMPQLAGRQLAGVAPSDFSKCFVTRQTDPPPEAVAFVDARSREQRPVRREFTEQHPAITGVMPGFDVPLVLTKRRK